MRWLLRKLILFSFWGAIAFSALLAIFAVSVGQLLPYLDHYRPQIEHNLQQIMGYPVTLEEIGGRLEGVDPTVSISGFHLLANGQTAITVSEMRVRLDAVKSLLTLSPKFTYIRFVRPTVALQENDGQWRLKGATPSRDVGNEVGVERVLDYLSAQRNFSIFGAELKIDSAQFGQHSVRIPHVYIFQKSFESLLTSELYLDDYQSPFEINARIDETRGLLGNYRVKASIKAPLFSIPLNEMLPENPYSLSSVELGGDIWLDALVGKELEVRTESTRLNVSFDDGQQYEVSSSIKLRYSQKHPNVRMDVHNMLIKDKGGLNYPTTDLSFDWSSVTGRSNVRFNRADLGLAHQIASHFLPAETNASAILNGLEPNGMAKNGFVSLWRENDELSFQFLSNLQAASINGYKGVPQASNINAVFSLSNESGYVDFRGTDSEIAFDTIYDDSWRTELLSGYVSWQQQQDVFLVEGRDLAVQRNGADVNGGFRLEVRGTEPDWIALDLHGRNLSVADRLTYLPPKALSADLMSWLKGAFADTGKVDSVDVLVQSELSDGAEPHVRVQLAVSDADVTFDENWPTATKVNGFFEFDEAGVSVQVKSGSLLDLPVGNLLLTVPISNGSADWLNLKGDVSNRAPLILATLRSTPLADSVLKPFANWQLDGDIKSDFAVSIPFAKGAEPRLKLGIEFKDNNLIMNDIELALDVKDGRLNYSSDNGITDSEFNAQTLGGASHLVLSSAATPDGGLAVMGELSGNVGVKQVAQWNKLPAVMVKTLSGSTAYTGTLSVNKSQEGQVNVVIESDLQGVGIDLPSPVGKAADETKLLRIKMMQHEKDIVIDADYASFSQARLLLQNNQFMGGELILNGNKSSPFSGQIPKCLVLAGDFDRINVPDWQSAFSKLSDSSEGTSYTLEVPKLPEWLSRVDLIVDEVTVNPDNVWHNFKVSYNVAADKSLYVSSDEMNFSLLNTSGKPDLHFGFLSWNTSKEDDSAKTDSGAKESPISAKQIPNMTLSVDQLYLNGSPYGDWGLAISRQGNLVKIDPISTKLKTGNFKGSLSWLDQGNNSRVDLSLAASGENLAELTHKFSNEAIVSSKKYNIDVGLGWKGHPFYFDRQSVSGHIDFSAEDGNFNKVDELPAFLKALGIFNIGALNRRLLLDFSDVYEPGLTYDEFNGRLSLSQGILTTTSPITINAPSAELVVAGEADIVNETLNEKLTATFQLSGTLPLAGLLWGTPQLAGLLYITDKLIGDQLSKVTSVQYKVQGSFNDPVMTPIRYKPLEKKD
ncbi:YhdP family protein [Marinomonas sp.]|uniref:YhdP family protein n=1 Tax=Marinomonas sp. TaxID=1904862 RepID=UPI003BAC801A